MGKKANQICSYHHKGLLDLVRRNASIKKCPQRFQDEKSIQFDIIFTFEDRVFEIVVEGNNIFQFFFTLKY